MKKEKMLKRNFQIRPTFGWINQFRLGKKKINITVMVALILTIFVFPQICMSDPYDITMSTPHEYDEEKGGRNNIMSQIDDFHYLCLYAGYTGMAVILTVDPDDWSITTETSYQYDEDGDYMGLSRIDTTHYLITYCGDYEEAYASVISIDPADWSITTETTIMYDYEFGYYNALSKIDDTHYLGVHNMWDVTGRAGVFTIDPNDWSITYGTEYIFEPESGFDFMLSKIDDTHHLCVYPYQGYIYGGNAVVLAVDTNNWTVTTPMVPFSFATDCDAYSFLSRIDDTHFLCAYQGPDSDGWAVILTVNLIDWSISMETPFEYDEQLGGEPNLAKIDSTHFLCAYKGVDADGYAVVLTVDPIDWSISKETPFEFDEMRADYPYLCKIDDAHYLCSYEGPGLDGWAVVLNVELPGVGVTEDEIISNIFRLSNFPNPFNTETTISFNLTAEDAENTELVIYNVKGQKVKTLISYQLSAGNHSVVWNGTDDNGNPVSSGIYFYKLSTKDKTFIKKMILMR
ncbi:MAG: T9SS type A sorting domain-containing protein [Candidatus Cloacimonetes bacterium]|nr:T9SS type A sorting domain-containing protein [Candidatus Cloacimonadota bacterium]